MWKKKPENTRTLTIARRSHIHSRVSRGVPEQTSSASPFHVFSPASDSLAWGVVVPAGTNHGGTVAFLGSLVRRLFSVDLSQQNLAPHQSVHTRPHYPTSLRTNSASRINLISQFSHNLTSDEQRKQDLPLPSTVRRKIDFGNGRTRNRTIFPSPHTHFGHHTAITIDLI